MEQINLSESRKKLLFIYNPNAGKGKIKQYLDFLKRLFDENGYDAEIYGTKAPMDGCDKIISDGEKYDRIICFGGDGTLNETVSGVMKLNRKPQIGFIPAGSTNDTAKNFMLPADLIEAAKTALTGEPFKVDIGSLGNMNFVYVASFGDISAVSAFTPQKSKRTFGHAAYIVEGIKTIPKMRYHKLRIEYPEGDAIEGEFYLGMITNSFQVGGFSGITGKSVDLQDGLFEVILLSKPRKLMDFEKQVSGVLIRKDDSNVVVHDTPAFSFHSLQELLNYSLGLENNPENTDVLPMADEDQNEYTLVYKFKASELTFSSEDEVQWVVDGEDAGKHNMISLKNHRQAVEIISKS